jgi:hypothetical protein
MAEITPDRPPALERFRLVFSELFAYRRPAMIGAFASVVAALVVISLASRNTGLPEGYGSPRAMVRAISTDEDAHSAPLLLTTDNGDSIVWFVDHIHENSESGSFKQEVDSEAQPRNKGGPRRNGGDL